MSANYASRSQIAADRVAILGWVIRSPLKSSGIWGGSLDTIPTAPRDASQQHANRLPKLLLLDGAINN